MTKIDAIYREMEEMIRQIDASDDEEERRALASIVLEKSAMVKCLELKAERDKAKQ